MVVIVVWRGTPRLSEGARPRVAVQTRRIALTETVIPNRPRPITFEILNLGDGALKLGTPQPSCGCSPVELESDTVPPRGSTKLVVNHAATRAGTFEHTIRVATNDPDNPSLVLAFHGEAKHPFDVQPGAIHVESGPSDLPAWAGDLKIFFDPKLEPDGPEVRLDPPNAGFEFVEMHELATDRMRILELQVSPMPNPGVREGKLALTSRRDPEIRMEAGLKHIARYDSRVEPESVTLPTSAGGETVALRWVCSWNTVSRPVREIGVEGEGFEVSSWRVDDTTVPSNLSVELRLPSRPGFHGAVLRPQDDRGRSMAEARVGVLLDSARGESSGVVVGSETTRP